MTAKEGGGMRVPAYPRRDPIPVSETPREARQRRLRYKRLLAEWERYTQAICARCGRARINVVHETDPATAPEGPEYYADIADLHEFVP